MTRQILSSANSFWLSSLSLISWLKTNLPSSLGGTSLVSDLPVCSSAILQGNLTFILTESMVRLKL